MAEYIEKNKIINLLEHNDKVYHYADRDKENIVHGTVQTLCRVIIDAESADVQPVDRWISVDDRLPEEIGYYLVIIGNDMLYSIDIAEYSENRWHKHDRVIYWQDLPDYPKSIKGARMDGEDNE